MAGCRTRRSGLRLSFRDGTEARDGPLRRPRRLDAARRERGPRGRPLAADAVLRPGHALHHDPRRHRPEVRRRRRDGGVRRPVRARGRPRAGGPRRARRSSTASATLGLEVRIGIETGEILSDETETTFATGLAINAAARLQQAAQPGEIMLGPTVERLTRRIGRHDAARRAGGARLPRRGRGLARRLGLRGGRPPARRLGAVRRARGGARAAPQHVRARRPGQPRAPRDGVRRAGRRQVAARAGVHRRRRALDDPHGPLPALRRGRHVLGRRRDGEGRRRHHRRRHGRRRRREAPELLRRRGGGRSAGARVRACSTRSVRRAVGVRDRLGRADVGDGARRPAAARARLRGHPLGRGADARPDRAPRERRQGRAAADPLPRPRGSARRAPGVGWRQRARDLDRARGAAASTDSAQLVDALVGGRVGRADRRSSARRCSGRPRATRSSSRRRCGCCSSPAASPTGSPTPFRR